MPLHRNKSLKDATMTWKGAPQCTFVKENHSLSRERATVMTVVSSSNTDPAPPLEYMFKGAGKRVKLIPPKGKYCDKTNLNFPKQGARKQ